LRPNFCTSRKNAPVPFEQQTEWDPKPVREFWRIEKSLAAVGKPIIS